MVNEQPSFTDLGTATGGGSRAGEKFLDTMQATIPWGRWMGVIEPHYYRDRVGKRGRKPVPLETMLRMYPCCRSGSPCPMRGGGGDLRLVCDAPVHGPGLRDHAGPGRDDAAALPPSAGEADLGARLLAEQGEIFTEQGWIMRGRVDRGCHDHRRTVLDEERVGTRDPEMHQTKKGNQWYFGMKGHIGVDAGTGYVHSVTATAANVHDLDQVTHLVRPDDEVVYADAGYLGVEKRPDVATSGTCPASVEDRGPQGRGCGPCRAGPGHRLCPGRCARQVEHPFLIVKRDFGFTKTRYRGLART